MKYHLTCFCFFTFFLVKLLGQSPLPHGKYQTAKSWNEHLMSHKEYFNKPYIELGVHGSNFLNPIFYNALENNDLSRAFGWYVKYEIPVYPFFFNVAYFSSGFKVENSVLFKYLDTSKVHHRGLEFSINVNPIPHGNITKILMPRIGIGYQLAKVCLACNQEQLQSAVVVNNLVWKAGILLNLGPKMYLRFDYKQSFLNKLSSHENQQFAIGLGYRPYNY